MSFSLYPAIDLRRGRVVRLTQGIATKETFYGDDPVAIAQSFAEEGAKWLHVVNLDGAFGEESKNLHVLARICKAVKTKVQFGGGLRDEAAVQRVLDLGPSRVVLGTVALTHAALVKKLASKLGEKLAVGIDAKAGYVTTEGWTKESRVQSEELAKRMIDAGVKRFIYTDVARDGMLVGPDLEGAKALAKLGASVIASGGVGNLDHVKAAKAAQIEGLIVGKALYEGRFTLRQALTFGLNG